MGDTSCAQRISTADVYDRQRNHRRHLNHKDIRFAPQAKLPTSDLGNVNWALSLTSQAVTTPQPTQGFTTAADSRSKSSLNVDPVNGRSVFNHSLRTAQRHSNNSSHAHVKHEETQDQSYTTIQNTHESTGASTDRPTNEPNKIGYDPFRAVGYQFEEEHRATAVTPDQHHHIDQFGHLPSVPPYSQPLPMTVYPSRTSQWSLAHRHQVELSNNDNNTSFGQFARQCCNGGSDFYQSEYLKLGTGVGHAYDARVPTIVSDQHTVQNSSSPTDVSIARCYQPNQRTPPRYASNGNAAPLSTMNSHHNHADGHSYRTQISEISEPDSLEVKSALAISDHPRYSQAVDENSIVPPYVALSIPTPTARFITRSSDATISVRQRRQTFTSQGSLSTTPLILSSRQARLSHASSDDAAVCPYCGDVASRATKINDRKSNLKRHIRDKHERVGGNKPMCPEPGCGKTFERSDYVLRHRRKNHGLEG